MTDEELYTSAAFFEQMATCEKPYRRLGASISRVLDKGDTVWDFGAAAGYVGDQLRELGWDVVDVDRWAPRALHEDLGQFFWIGQRDVVICTETAEHLPAEAADSVVDNVCRHAKQLIIWSAAPPGQAGQDPSAVGHINEQPPEYWLMRFAVRGWLPDEAATKALREDMWATSAQHMHCKDSFYVMVLA
jgi:hypothetical protein